MLGLNTNTCPTTRMKTFEAAIWISFSASRLLVEHVLAGEEERLTDEIAVRPRVAMKKGHPL